MNGLVITSIHSIKEREQIINFQHNCKKEKEKIEDIERNKNKKNYIEKKGSSERNINENNEINLNIIKEKLLKR